MNLPSVTGTIDRRILVNYRMDPDIASMALPAPFRPKLQDGNAIVGICLIRLSGVRPPHVPAVFGLSSENAAHRFAVEWDTDEATHEGVYIPRRDSSSRFNRLLGGRLFPGEHNAARFDVREEGDHYHVHLDSLDGTVHVAVDGAVAGDLPSSSVFGSLAEASRFFEGGSLGYSATSRPGTFDGLELRSLAWEVFPLDVSACASSYFEDTQRFPRGSAEFDCALLMRNVAHEWRAHDQLCSSTPETGEPGLP